MNVYEAKSLYAGTPITHVNLVVNGETIKARALWDTGASCPVVDKKFAEKHGMEPDGVLATGVRGIGAVPEKYPNVYVLDVAFTDKVTVGQVGMVEMDVVDDRFDVILGMDIMSYGTFSVRSKMAEDPLGHMAPSSTTVSLTFE